MLFMQPSDRYIIDGLLEKDENITREFFFVRCRPLIYSLIRNIFDFDVDHDELVNELYVYLMEDDGKRLRSFQGRSSIYQWLKCVATRFFLEKRDKGMIGEESLSDSLFPTDELMQNQGEREIIGRDVRKMLSLMRNPRHRLVIQRLFLDEVGYNELATELNTSVSNLYNLKLRSMAELTSLLLNEYGEK